MFDGSRFSREKLSFSEIDRGSKIFKKLVKRNFSPETSLALVMSHFKESISLTNALEISGNLLSSEVYSNLPKFLEDYEISSEDEKLSASSTIKEILSEVEVESAESQTVLKPLPPKIEKTSEKKATSKSKEVATPTITKVKARDKTLLEIEQERIADLETGILPDANSYQVNISGVPANLPDGYFQKILTLDEMREASKMYKTLRELKTPISRSIAKLIDHSKNIMLPSDLKMIHPEINNSKIYTGRALIRDDSLRDKVLKDTEESLIYRDAFDNDKELDEAILLYNETVQNLTIKDAFLKVMLDFNIHLDNPTGKIVVGENKFYHPKLNDARAIFLNLKKNARKLKLEGLDLQEVKRAVNEKPGAPAIQLVGYEKRELTSLEITHAIKSYEKLRETHSVARSTKELFELLKVNLVAKDCRAISAELNAATVSFARRQLSEKL